MTRNVMIIVLITAALLTACAGGATPPGTFPSRNPELPTITPLPSTPTPEEAETQVAAASPTVAATVTAAVSEDFFTQNGIALPAPACAGLTQSQTEGPYYTPNTPERNTLLEEGMEGRRLILAGYVLDQNCQPLPNAWLDFWQADANGEYDNAGYRLRGHQFTDAQGRYYLETILPGLYSSRPIEHIHVKVRPGGGEEVTSQLYFPDQPIEGLTVTIEERDGYVVGYFNFVVPG
jgi:protocatechuate 3,4-dioxygenase beta subunit